MVSKMNNTMALLCAAVTIGGLTVVSSPAHAGAFSSITNAITYPVRKIGSNASVDTHRVLQKNSVEKSNAPTPNKVVKPSGHEAPISPGS